MSEEKRMVLVDTQAAAAAAKVKPGTIRAWASRGKIQGQGKDAKGRTVYDLAEVYSVSVTKR